MSNIKLEVARAAMSVNEWAKAVGIGRTNAWAQIRDGQIEAIKVGHRTLITTVAADKWLSTRPVLVRRQT